MVYLQVYCSPYSVTCLYGYLSADISMLLLKQ